MRIEDIRCYLLSDKNRLIRFMRQINFICSELTWFSILREKPIPESPGPVLSSTKLVHRTSIQWCRKVFERGIITCWICFEDENLVQNLFYEHAPKVRIRTTSNAPKLQFDT